MQSAGMVGRYLTVWKSDSAEKLSNTLGFFGLYIQFFENMPLKYVSLY